MYLLQEEDVNDKSIPTVGMAFKSEDEAYDFYNLYSWDMGFGIRYGKSRHVETTKCMHEIVCGCSVRTVFKFFVNVTPHLAYLS